MTLKDQLLQLGLELATRLSSQDTAVANARSATTALSRARVERESVDLYLAALDEPAEESEEFEESSTSRASGT